MQKTDSFADPHFGPDSWGWKLCVWVHKVLLIPTGVTHQQTNVVNEVNHFLSPNLHFLISKHDLECKMLQKNI